MSKAISIAMNRRVFLPDHHELLESHLFVAKKSSAKWQANLQKYAVVEEPLDLLADFAIYT